MAQIISRLFNYIPDQALLLGGGEWIRPLGRLGDWRRIRLGMLVAVRPNGNSGNILNATLTLGLTSGRYNTVSGSATDNYVGMSLNGSMVPGTLRNWTWTANSGYPYYDNASAGNFFHRYTNPVSGQVYVQAASSDNNYGIPVAGAGYAKRRWPFVLEINRNPATGLYTFGLHFPNTNTSPVNTQDWGADKLLEATAQSSATVFLDGDQWSKSTNTLYASDIGGALDTFSVYWSNASYQLELYAACACLLADGDVPQPSYPFKGGGYDMFVPASAGDATGLNTGLGWLASYAFQGTATPTAQSGCAGSTSGIDDPFEQYASGTLLSANGGTNWGGAYTLAGTWSNQGSMTGIQWYGTALGASDPFEQYAAGSAAVLSLGTNWSAPYYALDNQGTTYANLAVQDGLGGTSTGMPWDSFEQYAAGTVTLLDWGTGWSTYGTFYAY